MGNVTQSPGRGRLGVGVKGAGSAAWGRGRQVGQVVGQWQGWAAKAVGQAGMHKGGAAAGKGKGAVPLPTNQLSIQ